MGGSKCSRCREDGWPAMLVGGEPVCAACMLVDARRAVLDGSEMSPELTRFVSALFDTAGVRYMAAQAVELLAKEDRETAEVRQTIHALPPLVGAVAASIAGVTL